MAWDKARGIRLDVLEIQGLFEANWEPGLFPMGFWGRDGL